MRTSRIALLGAVAALVTWLLGREATTLVGHPLTRVDDVVALGAAAAGAGVALWYTLTALALLLAELAALGRATARLAGALHATVDRLGAPVLRRAAVVAVGTGLALGGLPAGASVPVTAPEPAGTVLPADGAPPADDVVPHDLRPGLSGIADLPDGVATPAPQATAVPDDVTTPTPAPGTPPSEARPDGAAPTDAAETARGYAVRPGDSLWAITAAHLGPGATDAEIAAGWPRWHETNRAVIGADPHLIHPGQTLLAPDQKDPT